LWLSRQYLFIGRKQSKTEALKGAKRKVDLRRKGRKRRKTCLCFASNVQASVINNRKIINSPNKCGEVQIFE
jgi:hypothetical protein